MIVKITDSDGYTRRGKENECKWGEGVTHEAKGTGNKMCTGDFIHCYEADELEDAILLALFTDGAHGRYTRKPGFILWECVGDGEKAVYGTKMGYKRLTTTGRVPRPYLEFTMAERVEIAIRASLEVYDEPGYIEWVNAWLDGSDRSADAAADAADAADAAAYAARAAAYAARAAAYAADAADAAACAAACAAAYAAYATYAANAAFSDKLLAIMRQVLDRAKATQEAPDDR